MKNIKRLNLGCENEYKEGWFNLDFDKRVKADAYHDLNKFPWPFKDNEFDEILVANVLEHLSDVSKVMMELYRISKDKGILYISAPHFSNPFRWTELEHKSCFSHITFGEWHCNKELFPYFEVIKKKISFTRCNFAFMNKVLNPLINLKPLIYERLFSGIIPASIIVYILRVRKEKEFHEKKLRYLDYMEKKNKVNNLKFIREI